jgi:methionyl-tRNA formyltransferase
MLKTLFFGTPDLAVPFLEALTKAPDFEITAVITQPDRPVGRKQILTPSPIKELARKNNLPIFQPETLKKTESAPWRIPTGIDLAVVVAYGLFIPEKLLNLPRLGFVNVHPSLLPKYRGPSPIQSAIANGDAETGISIMLLDKGMDSGPLLMQEKIVLDTRETQETLTEKIKTLGPELLVRTLRDYAVGKISPQPQDDSRATICKLLDRESGHLDLTCPAAEIDRLVRAYQPWPGTWVEFNHRGKNLRVKILQTELNSGLLEITRVQPEGGAAMNYSDFVRGYGNLCIDTTRTIAPLVSTEF